jgi:uncharacterized membrane protein
MTLMRAPNKLEKWLGWLVALVLAFASGGVVIWQNARLAVLWDLSYILENSYRISLGDIPYRDFPFPYAPLTFLTQAALIKLTGRVFSHHVLYCAVAGGLSTLLTWRILLKILRTFSHAHLLALVLTAPLIVLGIYAIFPHPFYDPDCTFAVLACLLLLLRWDRKPTPLLGFIAGAVLVVPVFVKQNTGLAFIASAGVSLGLLFVIDVWRRRAVHKYIWLLAGLIVGCALALSLIHLTAGLGNYAHWTVRFAAERRTPALGDMIGVYRDPLLKWWLALFLVGTLVLWLSRGRRLLVGLSAIVMAAPFAWSVVYLFLDTDSSERAERLVGLWPQLLIISFVAMLLAIRRRRGFDLDLRLIVPLIIIATVHGAFLSQQLWGSTYALWPLFMILVATVLTALVDLMTTLTANPETASTDDNLTQHLSSPGWEGWLAPAEGSWPTLFAFVLSLCLIISGFFYLRSHERLDYANLDDGELTHSKLPALKGLSMRGSWITDFEELVEYTEKEIPRDDGILCLPGEDLFYYTTGRRPRFPVLMFDHTVNPYSPQEIVDLARARNIQWLIVKNELQLEEEPLEKKDELMNLLLKEFESVESLDNYEIYKRKSADSDDDTDSKDNEDDSEKP